MSEQNQKVVSGFNVVFSTILGILGLRPSDAIAITMTAEQTPAAQDQVRRGRAPSTYDGALVVMDADTESVTLGFVATPEDSAPTLSRGKIHTVKVSRDSLSNLLSEAPDRLAQQKAAREASKAEDTLSALSPEALRAALAKMGIKVQK